MTIRNIRARTWALIATALILATALGLYANFSFNTTEAGDPGRFSAFTREELRTNWKRAARFPLMVPADLPLDAGSGDEPGFVLENVVTDQGAPPARRVWVSYYETDVFGVPASFRVFQRPYSMTTDAPCGPATGQPFIERRIDEAVISICSSELSVDSPALKYWEKVTLTSELDDVGWLVGNE